MAGEPEQALAALRGSDPDRYLSTLYAPVSARKDLTTLYAFNVEIASIRDRIHEPMPGEIRIQWWRDTLAAGGEGASGHPLASALTDLIQRRHLPVAAFDRYLEARVFDLYDDPMPSRADLEGYLGETASALVQLASLVLEPEAAPAFAEAAGHAGCAQGIAGLLRMIPLHRARGQCYVPADLLAAAGCDRDRFVAGTDMAAVSRATEAMIALGREHAARFEVASRGMPASLRPAFLPAALSGAYFDATARLGADAIRRNGDISALRRHVSLLNRALRGWG